MSLEFFTSTVGKKYIMGVSGLIWTGFVMGHMAGNLLLFVGPNAYNSYGHALTSGNVIYVIEALLILALLTHVLLAIHLTVKNRGARPQAYAMTSQAQKGASLASRTMAFHGTLILAFVITHIRTFKFGPYYETSVNGVVMRDLHRLMVEVFSQPGYVGWYVLSLVLLGFHLRHGVSSVFQSFGLLHPSYQKPIKCFGVLYSVIVAAGFIAQPIYIFLAK